MAPRLKSEDSVSSFEGLMEKHKSSYHFREFRTNILALDFAAGPSRSFERGDSVLFWSEEGYGKSTVLIQIANNMHKFYGERSLYLDPEGGAKKLFMNNVDLEDLPFLYMGPEQGICYSRDIYRLLMQVLNMDKPPMHIFLDSLNKLKPHPEDVLDAKTGSANDQLGTEAKETKRFYDLFQPMCKAKGVTIWAIAQARANVDMSNPNAAKYNPVKLGAAHAAKHAQDIIIQFKGRPGSTGNLRDGSYFGDTSSLSVRTEGREFFVYPFKNRGGYANFNIPVVLKFGEGISNMHFRLEMMEWAGWYTGGQGGRYKLLIPGQEERSFHGSNAFFISCSEDEELRKTIMQACPALEKEFYEYLSSDAYGAKRK